MIAKFWKLPKTDSFSCEILLHSDARSDLLTICTLMSRSVQDGVTHSCNHKCNILRKSCRLKKALFRLPNMSAKIYREPITVPQVATALSKGKGDLHIGILSRQIATWMLPIM